MGWKVLAVVVVVLIATAFMSPAMRDTVWDVVGIPLTIAFGIACAIGAYFEVKNRR